MEKKRKCPVCENIMDDEYPYEICPVCYWEADPYQEEFPNEDGGANKISLNQARRGWLRSIKTVKCNIQETEGHLVYGKVYDVLGTDGHLLKIKNENGYNGLYPLSWFEIVHKEEYRVP